MYEIGHQRSYIAHHTWLAAGPVLVGNPPFPGYAELVIAASINTSLADR